MIKRVVFFGTMLAAAMLLSAHCRADVLVTRGIQVPLVFDQSVSSRSAHAGNTVALHVASDVFVNGKRVIRQGAHVTAVVTKVSHRNVFGVNGHLRLAFEPVRSTSGKFIDIEARNAGKYSGSRPDHAAEISGGAALVLGPVGLVGGVFVVGKNVTVHPGEKIMTFVSQDTEVR